MIDTSKEPVGGLYKGSEEGSRNTNLTRLVGSWVNDGLTFKECIENAEFAELFKAKGITDKEVIDFVSKMAGNKEKLKEILSDGRNYTGEFVKPSEQAILRKDYSEITKKLSLSEGQYSVIANAHENSQKAYLIQKKGGKVLFLKKYDISSGKHGVANPNDYGVTQAEGRTPIGFFHIKQIVLAKMDEKIKARKPQGVGIKINDLGHRTMATALFQIQGLEKGFNDKNNPHVYLHGTNQENRLGNRASGGCVGFDNLAMAEITYYMSHNQNKSRNPIYIANSDFSSSQLASK